MIPAHQVIGTLDGDEDYYVKVSKWQEINFWKVGHETLSRIVGVHSYSTFLLDMLMYKKQLFLDIKLWDTPRTVEATVDVWGSRGIKAISIRDSVITKDLARIANSHGLMLWAIGDKTSASVGDIPVVDISIPCSGIITSYPRWYINDKKILIVPGIRLNNQETHDHYVTWTPEDAIKAGADYIVVGRTLEDKEWWKENLEV